MSDQAAKVIGFDRSLRGGTATKEQVTSVFMPPKMPKFLRGEARKHWKELVESLGRRHGIINELDADILSMYCTTYARWLSADIDLEAGGLTQLTPNGFVQLSPEYIIWRDLTSQCLKIAKQLGLTPPARLAMKSSDPAGQDKFDF